MNLSLKPAFISVLTILLFALVFPLLAQQSEAVTPLALSQSPYRVGEKLTYNVSFSNFPSAAHVEVEVVSHAVHFGRDAIQLRAHVETTGVVNVALFAINNDYITYVDPETGLPFRSEETVRDAIKSSDSVQDFNQPAGNEAIPPKQKGFPGTYDFVSGFYRARALPLNEGGVYNFSVRAEASEYQAELKVTGREVIRTNVGSFPAIVTQIKVSNSPLRSLKVYFSDDAGHVPVLILARLSVGELRAELAGSELIKPPTETPTPTPPIIAAPAPTPAGPLPLSANFPFKLGEQLNYQVFIGSSNTPLGLVSFQIRGRSRYFERDGVFLTVSAQTTGAAAQMFVAKDQIDSYVDPKSLLPYRTVMNLAEGTRRLNQILTVSQETGTVTSDKGAKIDVPVGTHDYVSFFYVLRTLTPIAGKKNAISLLVENEPKTIFIDPLPRESIQLGPRRVQAIPLRLTTDDQDPDKYQFRVWLSDDHQRLPLRITCNTRLGPLRADLAILPTTSQ
ncbi:MAG TPA: DUF3108 domain-containing protein [Pyrinomonadaceae bacterium]|nr:DUF3108 domain-containing protein [Pyrinomonadaceae bacterium]